MSTQGNLFIEKNLVKLYPQIKRLKEIWRVMTDPIDNWSLLVIRLMKETIGIQHEEYHRREQ